MVVGAGTLFAVNGTISKLVIQAGVRPTHLTTLRATGAFLVLLGIVLANHRRPVRSASFAGRPGPVANRLAARWRELPMLAGYGLTGFFVVPILYFVAISRLPVGIGLLFEYTAPLLVAIWARFGQRQPVRPRLWTGLALSLAGLACVAQIWGHVTLDPLGIAAGFGAAALLAVFYVVGSHGVASRDPTSLTCWAYGIATICGAIARPWWDFPFPVLGTSQAGVPVWLLCCYVVVLGSVVPYLLVTGAMRHLPATSVGIVGMVEPVIATVVAWLALGEVLSLAQLLGGALVLAGVALAETARVATPEPTPAPVPTT
jgi:drug/metabolite transporter (DMT)-like permease